MLNIAYIGNGKATNRYHLPFVKRLDEYYHVKYIYSPSGTIRWPRIDSAEYITDMRILLNDTSIDLVVITTPTITHFKIAKQFLKKGFNVLVDKPFALSAKEAEELIELANDKGLFFQSYQNRRYDSDFLTLKKVLDSGALGDIHEIELTFDYYRPGIPKKQPHSKEASFLYGHASHMVDQVIDLCGKPDKVHYDVRQLTGPGNMNDYYDIDFYYRNIKVSVKSSYYRIVPRPAVVAYGSRGQFIKQTHDKQEAHLKLFYMPDQEGFGIDDFEDYGTITYYDENNRYHSEAVVTENGNYGQVYLDVYNSIVNNRQKVVTDEEMLIQMKILEEAYKQL